jgi:hypothetical protein
MQAHIRWHVMNFWLLIIDKHACERDNDVTTRPSNVVKALYPCTSGICGGLFVSDIPIVVTA